MSFLIYSILFFLLDQFIFTDKFDREGSEIEAIYWLLGWFHLWGEWYETANNRVLCTRTHQKLSVCVTMISRTKSQKISTLNLYRSFRARWQDLIEVSHGSKFH